MRITEILAEGKRPGLWDNIHAKRERIKHGSGERMRKPGSKGAPTAQAFKDSAKTDEAANPAQQAAIAINMKKHHQKPKSEGVAEGETWAKHNNPRAGGMSKKSVKSYRRSHPGSKIQTAVTTKPSKIKKGSKDAKRRASFCARMRGMKKHRTSAKTANDPNSNINKSLRRWHCESIEQLQELVMIAEQRIKALKK